MMRGQKMDNQDFESYALIKPFNSKVAETWINVAEEALARLGKRSDILKILDYGCGDGKYFPWFVSSGIPEKAIYGVEVSKNRIKRCQESGFKNVFLIENEKLLPFPNDEFDLINCMEVIEHIHHEEGRRILADIRRVLKPGGFLIISTPNYPIKRFYDLYDALIHGMHARFKDDPTHVTKFNHSKLKSALKEQGFSKIEHRVFKPGFLYKRFQKLFLEHKIFYLCS